MQNLIAFFIFQVTGLGFFSLCSPFFKMKFDKNNIGTAIFWGFWGGMLATYLFALMMPVHLNLACYLIFFISLFGLGRFIREKKVLEIFTSEYTYFVLFLLPFIFFLIHNPSSCDEYGHWVLLPKIYLNTNELITTTVTTSGVGYTPLWTLQAAFFEFLTPGHFSESIMATLKIGIFISFLFFLKETLNLKIFTFLLFSFLTFLITLKFNKHLIVEFPIYILITSLSFLVYAHEKGEEKKFLYFLLLGTLSLYMVKKSMIALLPALIWYLWVKNYKKELLGFLTVFCFLVVSWKIKTYGKSELLAPGQTINSFLSSDSFLTYSMFFEKVKEHFIYFLIFGVCLYLIFRESRKLFIFYALFSVVFILGLMVSYLFSFTTIEAIKLASFLRYLTSVFYPAYTLGLYIFISKNSEAIEKYGKKIGHKGILLGLALLSLIMGGSYVYQGYTESKRDYVGGLLSKIKPSHIPQHSNILILGPCAAPYEYVGFKYHLYPSAQRLDCYPLDKLADQDLDTFLSPYNLIVIRETNSQLNHFLKSYWEIDPMEVTQFYIYKENNKVEMQEL
jgi:hypothetical protein